MKQYIKQLKERGMTDVEAEILVKNIAEDSYIAGFKSGGESHVFGDTLVNQYFDEWFEDETND